MAQGHHDQGERIVPDRPAGESADAEALDVWGYADSGFTIDDQGSVSFRGSRYAISGTVMADFLPWARDVVDAPLPPDDFHVSRYPTEIPARVTHAGFEAAIAELLADDQIDSDERTRLRHGHGHTQEDMWAIKYGRVARVPDVVVRPTEEEQVERIVALAKQHGVCLIPYGGGTNVTEALRCPEDEGRFICSVDMRRMNRVLWIDPVNRVARIEAGANGREIGEVLEKHGFTLGHEPDSYEFSTLGGWVATNASGMKKNRYGNIEDLLLGVTAVTSMGTLRRGNAPARESVGGDPARWLIGSEGRLGIVTSAEVKIFPLPEKQVHGSVIFEDFETGVRFMEAVQRSGPKPASIRLMDNFQFQFGQALKPRKEGLSALKSKLEKLVVTKFKGFDVDKMVAVTLLFEGNAAEVAEQEKRVYAIASQHGGMKGGAENGQRGYALTFAIAYIRDFMLDHHVLAESFETTVPWSRVLDLCENVKQRIWQEHEKRGLPGKPFVSARVTQLYDTGVCVYFYFGYYHKGVEDASHVYSELEQAAREEILRSGGSLSHHHGIGKLRKHFLPEVLSETALRWREELKRAVDPEDVFGCRN